VLETPHRLPDSELAHYSTRSPWWHGNRAPASSYNCATPARAQSSSCERRPADAAGLGCAVRAGIQFKALELQAAYLLHQDVDRFDKDELMVRILFLPAGS